MNERSGDKRGEAIRLLKEVEDTIFQATGSALLAGEPCKATDKSVIYRSLCEAGNTVAYVRDDLLASSHVAAPEYELVEIEKLCREVLEEWTDPISAKSIGNAIAQRLKGKKS